MRLPKTNRSLDDILPEELGPAVLSVPIKGQVRGPLDMLRLQAEVGVARSTGTRLLNRETLEGLVKDVGRLQDLVRQVQETNVHIHQTLVKAVSQLSNPGAAPDMATLLAQLQAVTSEAERGSTLPVDLARETEKVREEVLALLPGRIAS